MHLVVYISSHGFGHAAQSCAVLNALAELKPSMRFTIVSQVDPAFLASRLSMGYQLIDRKTDFGLVMKSGIEIDLPASREAYRQWHAHWPEPVEVEQKHLAALKPDAVLSNIAYTPLAAARQLGVPGVALCCLNWATVYQHFFAAMPDSERIYNQIVDAYHQADVFFTTPPVWPMPEIKNQKMTALLAQQGLNKSAELRTQLQVSDNQRLVLIGLGGVATKIPIEQWPDNDDCHWLVPANWQIDQGNVSTIEASGLTFSDLTASVDLVLGKIGYGLVSECAVNGTPLLYIERPEWPEDQPFSEWLNANGRCAGISKDAVMRGDLGSAIEALIMKPAPVAPEPEPDKVAQDCLEYFV